MEQSGSLPESSRVTIDVTSHNEHCQLFKIVLIDEVISERKVGFLRSYQEYAVDV